VLIVYMQGSHYRVNPTVFREDRLLITQQRLL